MKAIFFSILLVTTLLFITQAGYAETFRWVDEYGKIRIGIKPSTDPENTKKDNKEGTAEIKKVSPTIAKPVISKIIVEHAMPSAKTIKKPQAVTPTPTPIVTMPEIIAPTQTPVSIQSPKPVQKTSVEKSKPVKQKTPVKKQAVKKAPTGKKSEKVISAKKKTAEKKSTNERNAEMCGVFTGYVNDYKEKVRDCSPNLCDIYKRSLARYKKKQRSYCK